MLHSYSIDQQTVNLKNTQQGPLKHINCQSKMDNISAIQAE